MSNHLGRLPQEALISIFEFVQTTDLLQCLLVCKDWQAPAKRQLYKHITFIRFSSIDRFIKRIHSSHDHSQLLVRKINFLCKDYKRNQHNAFKQQFLQVIALCPNVEWLGCSFELTNNLLRSLNSMPSPLKRLGVFPYAPVPEFTACAYRHSRSLKEYAVMDTFERRDFVDLIKFPSLEKLSLVNGRVPTLQDLEGILKVCQHLEYLSVRLLHKQQDDKYAPFDGETEQDAIAKRENPQMLQYSTMRRLMIRSQEAVLDLNQFIPFFRKFNQLKHFELETNDVLTPKNDQLQELEAFLGLIHALPSARFSVIGTKSSKIRAIALDYLRLFYHPDRSWKPTTLTIGDSRSGNNVFGLSLQYTITNTTHHTLAISLPQICASVQSLRDEYVNIFAPYINTLTVNLHYANVNDKVCELILHTLLTKCPQLNTLTIMCGGYFSTIPPTANTTLENLVIIDCDMTPEFVKSLSTACVNLRQLTLNDIEWSETNHIEMPQTELQQLNIEVGQYGRMYQGIILNVMTDKVSNFYHVDFTKWSVTAKQKRVKKWQVVTLKFKKVEQFRVLQMSENIPIDLN